MALHFAKLWKIAQPCTNYQPLHTTNWYLTLHWSAVLHNTVKHCTELGLTLKHCTPLHNTTSNAYKFAPLWNIAHPSTTLQRLTILKWHDNFVLYCHAFETLRPLMIPWTLNFETLILEFSGPATIIYTGIFLAKTYSLLVVKKNCNSLHTLHAKRLIQNRRWCAPKGII